MIYRQADGLTDLDARMRLMEMARRGSDLRARARRRALEAERREEQARLRAKARSAAAGKRQRKRRQLFAVSGLSWSLTWTAALVNSMIVICVVLCTLPLWLLAFDMGAGDILLMTASGMALPWLVTGVLYDWARRRLVRETQWQARPQGHLHMLARDVSCRKLTVEFATEAPNSELVADVLAAVAAQSGGRAARLIARTAVVGSSSRQLLLRHDDVSSPRDYLHWSHALIDEVLPVLADAYPISRVRVAGGEA
jgi:hypothetical protein